MGSSRIPSPTRPLSPAQARRRVEADLGATIVEAPATGAAAGGTGIPGLGYMPAPGHLTLPTPVEQNLTRYLFAR